MWRTALLLFVIIAPVTAGVLVLAALLTPALQDDLGRWIVIAAIVGAVLGIPLSYIAAKHAPGQIRT